MTIGNSSKTAGISTILPNVIGQSFINDPTKVTGTSILLNDWTFNAYEAGTYARIYGPLTLNIYAGTNLGSIALDRNGYNYYTDTGVTLIGSSTTYTTAGSFWDSTATWTFAGGLSLIDNQTYTAAVTSPIPNGFALLIGASGGNPYANGYLTTTNPNSLGQDWDTVFTANFSAAPTPVPFEFEPTGGLLVLGGGWLLRRHLKKRATKVK